MTAAADPPTITSTAKPRSANSVAMRHQPSGRPPCRSGETSTNPSTSSRSTASSAMTRTRTDGLIVPIGCAASSAKPICSSHRRACSGVAGRPANMSSSPTTAASVTPGCGSLTSGASTSAMRRRRSRSLRVPSIVTSPVSGRMRPVAMSPSTVGRSSVSASTNRAWPVSISSDVVGSAWPFLPLLTSCTAILMRGPPRRESWQAYPAHRPRRVRGARRSTCRSRASRAPRC